MTVTEGDIAAPESVETRVGLIGLDTIPGAAISKERKAGAQLRTPVTIEAIAEQRHVRVRDVADVMILADLGEDMCLL